MTSAEHVVFLTEVVSKIVVFDFNFVFFSRCQGLGLERSLARPRIKREAAQHGTALHRQFRPLRQASQVDTVVRRAKSAAPRQRDRLGVGLRRPLREIPTWQRAEAAAVTQSLESERASEIELQQRGWQCVRFAVELDIICQRRFFHLTIKATPHTHVKVSIAINVHQLATRSIPHHASSLQSVEIRPSIEASRSCQVEPTSLEVSICRNDGLDDALMASVALAPSYALSFRVVRTDSLFVFALLHPQSVLQPRIVEISHPTRYQLSHLHSTNFLCTTRYLPTFSDTTPHHLHQFHRLLFPPLASTLTLDSFDTKRCLPTSPRPESTVATSPPVTVVSASTASTQVVVVSPVVSTTTAPTWTSTTLVSIFANSTANQTRSTTAMHRIEVDQGLRTRRICDRAEYRRNDRHDRALQDQQDRDRMVLRGTTIASYVFWSRGKQLPASRRILGTALAAETTLHREGME